MYFYICIILIFLFLFFKKNNDFENILKPMLINRAPGSFGNKKVRSYIKNKFKKLNWHVEEDFFQNGCNIIATKNPNAEKKVIFAAHYDTLKKQGFIGAIDSAVSCAILIYLANDLQKYEDKDTTLQFIFFDREEESITGSIHLAQKWKDNLKNVEFFVLLDLIGSIDTNIPNTNKETEYIFTKFLQIQDQLLEKNIISFPIFKNSYIETRIIDDHLPFKQLGVPVVHCISIPFPKVWHTLNDNKKAISKKAVESAIFIFKYFILDKVYGKSL